MKYKVGDKVRINKNPSFSQDAIKDLKKVNYTVIIKEVCKSFYIMEEIDDWGWRDGHIERLAFPVIIMSTNKRFKLMDLD